LPDGICSRQPEAGDWTDIVKAAAGWYHTVGLTTHGTVFAVGWNDYGQCDVGGWILK
jgi:alpha-tubulin suppressor-like RCC1 family protein